MALGHDRFFYRINGTHTRRGAILKAQDYHYLLLNKNDLRAARLHEGIQATVDIWPDTSAYGMDMPRELEAALDANEGIWEIFSALSPGKKRYLLYWVSQVKSQDKRIQRAMAVAQHLLESLGQLDFKKIIEINRAFTQATDRRT